MGKAIVVTSGKGGVGKSTVSANVGVLLAASGRRTLVIDADLGLRNLDLLLGVSDQVVFDLVDVLSGECGLERALITDKRYRNLSFLPASQTHEKAPVSPRQMVEFIQKVKGEFDYVITDCPAGLGDGFLMAIAGCDQAIIVITPDLPSLRDADRIAGILDAQGIAESKILINKLRPNMVQNGEMLKIEEIMETMGLDLLGVVPEDETVITCANKGTPAALSKNTAAARAYMNITGRITGKKIPLLELDGGKKKSFWRRRFGKK